MSVPRRGEGSSQQSPTAACASDAAHYLAQSCTLSHLHGALLLLSRHHCSPTRHIVDIAINH
eukprot:1351192-Pleurochrysis_carterae.AAC.1